MREDELADFQERHQLSQAAVEELASRLGVRAVRAQTAPTESIEPSEETRRDPPPLPDDGSAAPDRPVVYDDLGGIGSGGVGEVRRVRDRRLNRTMAMKILRAELSERPSSVARLVAEAQTTAQLQHPGIVPVHELGRLPDGRIYYTMQEIRGRTLGQVIDQVHSDPEPRAGGWTAPRLVAALHQVCLAVAFAHERGVVHRDLKPENVMLGAFGQVQVVDWGLARVIGQPREADGQVVTDRSLDIASRTLEGTVAGTPAYMAPEQARGDVEHIDARTDVYALGCLLYEILTGSPPYDGLRASDVLERVRRGPPPPPTCAVRGVDRPEELVELCQRAMARKPEDRHESAVDLAADLEMWLDGTRRRARALQVVARAGAARPAAAALRLRAEELRLRAEALLADVPDTAPVDAKAPGWELQDAADELERAAALKGYTRTRLLQAALTHAADLPEAHAALAEDARAAHAEAEERGDLTGQAESLVPLSAHTDALPRDHPTRVRCAAYLEGTGALTLVTDPPGARVRLYRYERRRRQLVPVEVRELGTTPLQRVPLPMGSYLCVLSHPGCADVRYPVHLTRLGHWDGVPPGGDEPLPVRLPAADALAGDECYVPPGWYRSGGDDGAYLGLAGRRLWVDGLVVQRSPVTNWQYLTFLDDLVAQGREEDALRFAPRERPGQDGALGALVYARTADGRFRLARDGDGDLWDPACPVVMIDWHCACAYAAWWSRQTGHPWRLPGELEWEKAARGVDGRIFPWGDHVDRAFAAVRMSHAVQELMQPAGTPAADESPYGVRGMAGNVADWCADVFLDAGPPVVEGRVVVPEPDPEAPRVMRVLRGGAFSNAPVYARCGSRRTQVGEGRYYVIGARLVRSFART